jgi:hypothetical protein
VAQPAASGYLSRVQLRLYLRKPLLDIGVCINTQPRDKRREAGTARLERFGERHDFLAGMASASAKNNLSTPSSRNWVGASREARSQLSIASSP